MRESALQASCIALARDAGVLALNVHGSGWSNKGLPDLLLFGGGRAVAVELKAGTGYRMQPDQLVWRKRFLAHGIPHHVVDSREAFAGVLSREFKMRLTEKYDRPNAVVTYSLAVGGGLFSNSSMPAGVALEIVRNSEKVERCERDGSSYVRVDGKMYFPADLLDTEGEDLPEEPAEEAAPKRRRRSGGTK